MRDGEVDEAGDESKILSDDVENDEANRTAVEDDGSANASWRTGRDVATHT